MEDSELIEHTVSSEPVFDGKLLHVRRDTVRMPDGHETIREWITHPGAVVVIAALDNGKFLFERQFRYPLRRIFLELPAGKIDPDEHPAGHRQARAARRNRPPGEVLASSGNHASLHRLFRRAHRNLLGPRPDLRRPPARPRRVPRRRRDEHRRRHPRRARRRDHRRQDHQRPDVGRQDRRRRLGGTRNEHARRIPSRTKNSTSIPPAATRWKRCMSSPRFPATSPTRTTSTNCSAASSAP
jgi:hypothetical protein